MDDSQEGVLLIATTMVVLVAFALTVLAVMLIYRKRKVQHLNEIKEINEKFSKELLLTQLEVQQETMQYIGSEIHDNVGQQLTLAFLYTQQLHPEDQKIVGQINSIATIINDSLRDLRNLSKSLTETYLMDQELDGLIRHECSKVQNIGLCKVIYSSTSIESETSKAVKSFVLRILQEFLQNSLKHSGCTVIEVELVQMDKGVQLSATDNGKGFEPEKLLYHSGIGLKNMRKRASIIHAEWEIKSALQQGTRMKLFIPAHQLNLEHAIQHSNR